jgi:hypothetical protein
MLRYLLQNAAAVDENLCAINKYFPSEQIFNLNIPQTSQIVPLRSNDFVIELEIFRKCKTVDDVLEVL